MLRLRKERYRGRGDAARRLMELYYSMTDEECFESLRDISGEDFGTDLDLWDAWVATSVDEFERDNE